MLDYWVPGPGTLLAFSVGSGCWPILRTFSGLHSSPKASAQNKGSPPFPPRVSTETLSYVGEGKEAIKGLENETDGTQWKEYGLLNLWRRRRRGCFAACTFSSEQSLRLRSTASCSASPLKTDPEETSSGSSIRDLGHKKALPDFEKC